MKNNDESVKKYIERERELSHLVFSFYMDSVTRADYNKKIRYFSDVTHLDVSYLCSLKDVYLEKYASDDERKSYHSRMKNVPNYIIFCEQLFSLKSSERINFIASSKLSLSDLKKYFNSYKKYNLDNCEKVDVLIKQYEDYLSYSKIKSKEEKKRINYNEACAFYQNIIDLGFYSVRSYALYCEKDKNKVLNDHRKYRNYIKAIDESVYDNYVELMEVNRKKTFFFIKDKVDKFNSELKQCISSGKKYDIIDYYLSVGISLSSFKEICKDLITSSEMGIFNKFSSNYIELENSDFDESTVFSSVNFINGREITDVEKSMVYSFLKENDIPIVYFNHTLYKYANGELDKYIGGYIKKKNSNV